MEDRLLSVSEIAKLLGVKPSWVYSHADTIGVFRLGKYLRFSWIRTLEFLEGRVKTSERCSSTATVRANSERANPRNKRFDY
jgi:hypothetical protein